jgi:hypothetical protein
LFQDSWKHHRNKSFWHVFQQFQIHIVSFSLTGLPRVHLSAVLLCFVNTKSKSHRQ